jgi:hypothetical protein
MPLEYLQLRTITSNNEEALTKPASQYDIASAELTSLRKKLVFKALLGTY